MGTAATATTGTAATATTGTAATATTGTATARVRVGDAHVVCGAGETVLHAALRDGWDLPYECASGGCGSCRAVLVEGAVRTLWPQAPGLTERDRRKGDRVLACQSVPERDCVLRLPGGGPASQDGTRPTPLRTGGSIAGVEHLSAATLLVTIEPDQPVAHLAGQFVVIELPGGVRRAYSMSREPDCRPVLELVVRLSPDGAASSWLTTAAPGDRLVVEGPYGRAHVQSPGDRPVVCVGGGSGLGPALAIAERCLTEAPVRAVRLYYGARSDTDVVLVERLLRLTERGATVDVVTDEVPSPEAVAACSPLRLRGGRVVDALDADYDGPAALIGHDLYLAGPTPMVDALLTRLVRTGRAAADRTFFDRFL